MVVLEIRSDTFSFSAENAANLRLEGGGGKRIEAH